MNTNFENKDALSGSLLTGSDSPPVNLARYNGRRWPAASQMDRHQAFEAMLRNHPDKTPEDEELIDLLVNVTLYSPENPPSNPKEKRKWRLSQDKLIRKIQSLEHFLASSNHPEFAEAKNYILGEISATRLMELKLKAGKPIQTSLAVFLNHIGGLRYCEKNLYRDDYKKPDSLNRPIGEDGLTLEDSASIQPPQTWSRPLPLWDELIQAEKKDAAEIVENIQRYVQEDANGTLRNCHLRNRHEFHAQLFILRHTFDGETIDSLATEFKIPKGTVRTFWTRKVQPLLRNIAINQEYSLE